MAGGGETELLQSAVIYLGAAVAAAPLFKRLKLGSVLGYLAAGVAIGPNVLGLIPASEDTLHVAEFGVVLLLFIIGLELKPERLWRLRVAIFGLGAAQVLITGLVVAAGVWAFGMDWRASIVAGAGLALSSTAFAIQILREKGDLAAPYGDRAFAILLFQDLAIVPLIALVTAIAPVKEVGGDPTWLAALKGLGAVLGVFLAGRYGLRPLFHIIAQTRADEIFTAAALLVVAASAWVMDIAGLSMAMGAFLAGVLLAETEFRHQLETDIEPFRGLLMGLFFMAVGASVNLHLVFESYALVLGAVAALVVLKALLLYGITRLGGSGHEDAMKIAAVLSQGGEFGFVLFTLAQGVSVLEAGDASLLAAIITLSMVTTPLATKLAARLAEGAQDTGDDLAGPEDAPNAPIIIAGFGRMGQVVGRVLRLRGYELTLIDNSPARIRVAQTFGNQVFFGDARRLDTLATAGADEAQAIFICLDDRDGARLAVERIRKRFPNMAIFASTYDRFSLMEMEKAGAHHVERENFEAAVNMARNALKHFGDGDVADDVIEEFRRRDAQLLKLQSEYGALEGLKKLREGFTLEKER